MKIISREAESVNVMPNSRPGSARPKVDKLMSSGGKIGIFDSGLGGLVIARAIMKRLPQYDYIYLGDTKRVPYGNRSTRDVYKFTRAAVKYLFKHDCQLVILACNTASALALRKIQQEFLPKFYPNRRVLGVIIPTLESVFPPLFLGEGRGEGFKRFTKIGVIGTPATIRSHIYKRELMKIDREAKIFEQAAPELVTMIENNQIDEIDGVLNKYLNPLTKHKISAVVLGCTHYPILKPKIRQIVGKDVKIVSQDQIIPLKLANYLRRHKEISGKLDKTGKREFLVTKQNRHFNAVAKRLFGKKLKFEVIKL